MQKKNQIDQSASDMDRKLNGACSTCNNLELGQHISMQRSFMLLPGKLSCTSRHDGDENLFCYVLIKSV